MGAAWGMLESGARGPKPPPPQCGPRGLRGSVCARAPCLLCARLLPPPPLPPSLFLLVVDLFCLLRLPLSLSVPGNPRNKVALAPGHSLMDWIRLGNSSQDLTGVGGRVLDVTPEQLAQHNTRDDAWLAIRGACVCTLCPPRVVFPCTGEGERGVLVGSFRCVEARLSFHPSFCHTACAQSPVRKGAGEGGLGGGKSPACFARQLCTLLEKFTFPIGCARTAEGTSLSPTPPRPAARNQHPAPSQGVLLQNRCGAVKDPRVPGAGSFSTAGALPTAATGTAP